jgi:hypothetical protein
MADESAKNGLLAGTGHKSVHGTGLAELIPRGLFLESEINAGE